MSWHLEGCPGASNCRCLTSECREHGLVYETRRGCPGCEDAYTERRELPVECVEPIPDQAWVEALLARGFFTAYPVAFEVCGRRVPAATLARWAMLGFVRRFASHEDGEVWEVMK